MPPWMELEMGWAQFGQVDPSPAILNPFWQRKGVRGSGKEPEQRLGFWVQDLDAPGHCPHPTEAMGQENHVGVFPGRQCAHLATGREGLVLAGGPAGMEITQPWKEQRDFLCLPEKRFLPPQLLPKGWRAPA